MPIVTDGLVGYWNSKQGVNGSVWENIAPSTKGTLNGTITGAVIQSDGMYFDGVDDGVAFNTSLGLIGDYTIELWVRVNATPTTNGVLVKDVNKGLVCYRGLNSKFRTYNFINVDTLKTYAKSVLHHVILRYHIEEDSHDFYINNTFDVTHTDTGNPRDKVPWDSTNWAIGRDPMSTSSFFKGHISVVRFYNRILTLSEIAQNYAINTEIGLTVSEPSSTPVVSHLTTNKSKISDEPDVNQSIITVQFDLDVTEYVARLNGTDHLTGVIVHQGGAVSANTNAQVVIDWDELSTEGANRINIYGKSLEGQWTPYSPN